MKNSLETLELNLIPIFTYISSNIKSFPKIVATISLRNFFGQVRINDCITKPSLSGRIFLKMYG
jgi:hypothetical protein